MLYIHEAHFSVCPRETKNCVIFDRTNVVKSIQTRSLKFKCELYYLSLMIGCGRYPKAVHTRYNIDDVE